MKARQNFRLLNLAANKSLKDRVTFGARKLPLEAIMGIGAPQSLPASLHLGARDFAHSNGKIHQRYHPSKLYRISPPHHYRKAPSIAFSISPDSGVTSGSNRATTFPSFPIKNLVKFH